MIQVILDTLFDIFDIFVNLFFFYKILGKKRSSLNIVIYILLFSSFSILPIKINTWFFPHPLTGIYSLLLIIIYIVFYSLICLLHNGSMKLYIFTIASIMLSLFLSDYLVNIFVYKYILIDDSTSITDIQMTYISFVSEFLFVLMLIIISFFWNRKKRSYSFEYNVILIFTPVVSIIIISIISMNNIIQPDDIMAHTVILFCIVLLNIINYVMIEKSASIISMKEQNRNMQRQIEYQKEKYRQLNTSYKNTRKLIHDTNKHYLAMQELVKSKNYDKLNDYIQSATDSMNSIYIKYNTGNLVIDSFLTYYENLAEEKNISFKTEVSVDADRVPLSDYDLCVILGNILDNGIDACNQNINDRRVMTIDIYIDDGNRFIIHSSNPFEKSKTYNNIDDLDHGYGLENIKNTISKYNGNTYIEIEDDFTIYVMIPILA